MSILKRLKTRTILVNSDAIWNCNESLENKEAKFCLLMLFETKFWNYRETLESNDAKWCILTLFKHMSVRIHQDTFHAMDRANRQWKVRVANISCAIILHQSAFVFYCRFGVFRFSIFKYEDTYGRTCVYPAMCLSLNNDMILDTGYKRQC